MYADLHIHTCYSDGTDTPTDVLSLSKKIGLSVIAHPKLADNDDAVLDLIRCGVEGVEVYYPLHSAGETQKYLHMAQEHGLLVTGGSDWHGKNSAPEVTHMGVTGLENGLYGIFHVSQIERSCVI